MTLPTIHKLSTKAHGIFRWTACGRLALKKTTDATWYTVTCGECLKKGD